MGQDALTTYLRDHLGGAESAIELLGRLAERHGDTPLGGRFVDLRLEIQADQRALLALLEGGAGRLKRAAGWAAEKLARIKIGDDGDPLALLESLELLALGIQGKCALWRAVAAGAAARAHDAGLDLATLERRAQQQFEQVERERIAAAQEA